MLFLTGLFEQLPEAVLGAIVIHAVSGMIDFRKLTSLRAARTPDFWAALGALAGVIALGILPGLAIGIGLSLVLFVHRLDHPHIAVLGRLPDGTFADTTRDPSAVPIDGVLVYRLDAPLIFANADVVVENLQLRELDTQRIVLDMESVYEIDTQGADALARLVRELSEKGVTLVLAAPHAPSEICSSGCRSHRISGPTVCSTQSRRPSGPALVGVSARPDDDQPDRPQRAGDIATTPPRVGCAVRRRVNDDRAIGPIGGVP